MTLADQLARAQACTTEPPQVGSGEQREWFGAKCAKCLETFAATECHEQQPNARAAMRFCGTCRQEGVTR